MKIKIDTVTYRVTPEKKLNRKTLSSLEKRYRKEIPQLLWMSFSSDPDQKDTILVSACKTINNKKLKEIFE